MRYRVNWTERVGYYAYIEADTPEEAVAKCMEHDFDSCEPDDFCEFEDGSMAATPDPECDEDDDEPISLGDPRVEGPRQT